MTANRVLEPSDEDAVRQLSPAEDQAALEAMRSVVRGEYPTPTPAPYGVRWSDVPEAARIAASDVDMAIVRATVEGDVVRFEILTVRDEPAQLVVERRPPPTMVRATATVGTFDQHPKEAERLLAAFDRTLRLLGKKPGFAD